MDIKNYPEIVQEWMEIIKESAGKDTDRLNEYVEKLKHYAEDNGSVYLIGYCFYYQGHNAYSFANLDLCMESLTEALKYLSMAESWTLVAHCYNVMGNIAIFQSDISLGTDCYIKCLAMARLYNLKPVEYNVCSNIGNIHMMLGDYKNALQMLEMSEKMTAEGLVMRDSQRSIVAANLAVCCTQLGLLDRAAVYLDKVRNFIGPDPEPMDQIMLCILETQYYNRTGETTARDQAIGKLNAMNLKSIDVYDALSELSSHAKLLLDIGEFSSFTTLILRMEMLDDNPTIKRYCLELRMKYYHMIGDEANYTKTTVEYAEMALQREMERNRIVSHNILTRMRLEDEEAKRKEAERSNVVLKERSEHDALTGLNNRFKLNELSEAAFQRAWLSQKPLTVEILDIDCYKQFNDNYGHQAGDDCLIQIAGAIRSMEEFPRIHTARYGGDEFVVVYEEYTLEEVEKLAATLQQRIEALNIEHKHSAVSDHVTISQGLFHKTPVAGNKLWDFMYCADMALYIIKRTNKGSFHIATDFNKVRDEFQAMSRK